MSEEVVNTVVESGGAHIGKLGKYYTKREENMHPSVREQKDREQQAMIDAWLANPKNKVTVLPAAPAKRVTSSPLLDLLESA